MNGMAVCILVIIAMAQLMVEAAQAFICAEVAPNLVGCVSFLTGADSKPDAACCNGVKKVKGFCVSTDDKKVACRLKLHQTGSFSHTWNERVQSLLFQVPTARNQPLPFSISTTFDCNSIA